MRDGIIPDDISLDGVVPCNFDPEMAPQGKQMLLLGTWCTPDPHGKEIKALHKKVNDLFEEVFPDAVPYIESIEEYMGPAEVSALSSAARGQNVISRTSSATRSGAAVTCRTSSTETPGATSRSRKPSPSMSITARSVMTVETQAGAVSG